MSGAPSSLLHVRGQGRGLGGGGGNQSGLGKCRGADDGCPGSGCKDCMTKSVISAAPVITTTTTNMYVVSAKSAVTNGNSLNMLESSPMDLDAMQAMQAEIAMSRPIPNTTEWNDQENGSLHSSMMVPFSLSRPIGWTILASPEEDDEDADMNMSSRDASSKYMSRIPGILHVASKNKNGQIICDNRDEFGRICGTPRSAEFDKRSYAGNIVCRGCDSKRSARMGVETEMRGIKSHIETRMSDERSPSYWPGKSLTSRLEQANKLKLFSSFSTLSPATGGNKVADNILDNPDKLASLGTSKHHDQMHQTMSSNTKSSNVGKGGRGSRGGRSGRGRGGNSRNKRGDNAVGGMRKNQALVNQDTVNDTKDQVNLAAGAKPDGKESAGSVSASGSASDDTNVAKTTKIKENKSSSRRKKDLVGSGSGDGTNSTKGARKPRRTATSDDSHIQKACEEAIADGLACIKFFSVPVATKLLQDEERIGIIVTRASELWTVFRRGDLRIYPVEHLSLVCLYLGALSVGEAILWNEFLATVSMHASEYSGACVQVDNPDTDALSSSTVAAVASVSTSASINTGTAVTTTGMELDTSLAIAAANGIAVTITSSRASSRPRLDSVTENDCDLAWFRIQALFASPQYHIRIITDEITIALVKALMKRLLDIHILDSDRRRDIDSRCKEWLRVFETSGYFRSATQSGLKRTKPTYTSKVAGPAPFIQAASSRMMTMLSTTIAVSDNDRGSGTGTSSKKLGAKAKANAAAIRMQKMQLFTEYWIVRALLVFYCLNRYENKKTIPEIEKMYILCDVGDSRVKTEQRYVRKNFKLIGHLCKSREDEQKAAHVDKPKRSRQQKQQRRNGRKAGKTASDIPLNKRHKLDNGKHSKHMAKHVDDDDDSDEDSDKSTDADDAEILKRTKSLLTSD